MESPQRAHTPRKKRKPTYLVRKQQADELRDEVDVLQSQLQFLQAKAKQAAMTPDDHRRFLTQSLRTKTLLQQLLLEKQLTVAAAQSKFQDNPTTNPLYTFIHLPKAWGQRQQLLSSLKDEMISRACNYAIARSEHLNLLAKCCSEQRFEDDQGSLNVQRFGVTHVVGQSLRQVFEAAKFFLTNVEITTSEALGFITVREDFDVEDEESTSNFRLISGRPGGFVTESNKVLYNRYFEEHGLFGGRPCAIMATDSVDVDEQYPYDPKKKVRLDVSAAIVITEEQRTTTTGNEEERIVVIQNMSFMKICQPEFSVPDHVLQSIADGCANWSKVMAKAIREYVDSRSL